MTATEGGATLAWRLLATLEGGSLLLATSALLAYTARVRVVARHRTTRAIKEVLVTNINDNLGREIKSQLESRGCIVCTVPEATSGADSDRVSANKVDALVVVGAEPKADDLSQLANLVTEDVYKNLKLLEELSSLVRRGGSLSWACTGQSRGVYTGASSAFDAVLQASLQHIARKSHCQAVWVGRYPEAERVADRIVEALLHSDQTLEPNISVSSFVQKVNEHVGRWIKKLLDAGKL